MGMVFEGGKNVLLLLVKHFVEILWLSGTEGGWVGGEGAELATPNHLSSTGR